MPVPQVPEDVIKECAKAGSAIAAWRCFNARGYKLSLETVRVLISGVVAGSGGDVIEYRLPPAMHPDAVSYPKYTLAEAIYIAVYQDMPDRAHVVMYRVLEDPLLRGPPWLRQALFIPVDNSSWDRVMTALETLLTHDRVKEVLCPRLRLVLTLLVSSLPPSNRVGSVITKTVPRGVTEKCG